MLWCATSFKDHINKIWGNIEDKILKKIINSMFKIKYFSGAKKEVASDRKQNKIMLMIKFDLTTLPVVPFLISLISTKQI